MSSIQPRTDTHAVELPSTAEEGKLDAALRKADQILVASLQDDERRRTRRRIALLSGGLVMITAGIVIALSLLNSPSTQPADDAAAPTTQPSPQDAAKAEDLSVQGWQLWQERKLAEAEQAFAQSAKLDPDAPNTWNGLGWSQMNQGKRLDAAESFQKCVALQPDHPAALNGLGWLSFGKREYDAAEKYWLHAAKTPGASAAWTGLAQLYLLQGKFDDAKVWAQKLVNAGNADARPLLDAANAKKLDDSLRQKIEPPDPAA